MRIQNVLWAAFIILLLILAVWLGGCTTSPTPHHERHMFPRTHTAMPVTLQASTTFGGRR